MSFQNVLNTIDLSVLESRFHQVTESDVQRVMSKTQFNLDDFPILVSEAAAPFLEKMASLGFDLAR